MPLRPPPMQLFSKLDHYAPDSKKPLVLGLGNFDGLHLGHRALLDRVIHYAKQKKGASAVFTFREHPQAVLHPEAKPPLLTSTEHKLYFFHALGLDTCFLVPFTKTFSEFEPAEFVEKILVQRLNVSAIFLGFNARFGKGRKGDGALMRELARKFGFYFEEIPPVKAAGDFVSSSRIRQFIQAGNLSEAEACLGRPFSVFAKVIPGDGRGRQIGFPTANLEFGAEVLPPEGVYSVKLRFLSVHISGDGKPMTAEIENAWRQGVLNFGRRPTFKEKTGIASLEVHILDFDQQIYGRTLEIVFCERLRGEKAFSGPEELKRQITLDIEAARSGQA